MQSTTSSQPWNGARFVRGSPRGAYESWFQRANHPTRPLAFWIRYTIFAPRGRPADAVGELWAVAFDGESRRVIAVKEEHPVSHCSFAGRGLDVTIASSRLSSDRLEGAAELRAHRIAWSLRFTSPRSPVLLLPEALYAGSFPKAKALVGSPLARFQGTLDVDGVRWVIDDWVGSQNHNWGSEHTARYAWGQVAGFDDAPDAFLEVSTARVRLGPTMTPPMTLIVLRLDGDELRFSSVSRALRARGAYVPFQWSFETGDASTSLHGSIAAPAWAFVALPYADPPGGTKTCLNTKIARCDLTIERRGEPLRTLSTAYRAAFEILGDEAAPPGVCRLE